MTFDSVGTTTIVSKENSSIAQFLIDLNKAYEKIIANNIIINLTSFKEVSADQLATFLDISSQHKKTNKSFVLVSDKVGYDDIPETLVLVPSLQEAHDIIEMEEIERDLGI